MKKILCLMIGLCLLLSGCSQKKPEEILKEAYEKNADLSSLTMDGKMVIGLGSGGSTFEIPMDIVMMYERGDKDDTADDVSFVNVKMSVLGQDLNTSTWTAGGMTYVDTGDGKYCAPADTDAKVDFDTAAFAKTIIENADDIKVSKDGGNTVLTVTPNDKLIAALLNDLGGSAGTMTGDLLDEETLQEMEFGDIVITIDKEGYIDKVSMTAKTVVEDMDMDLSLDLQIRDRNSTEIPAFDPSEFSEEDDYEEFDDIGLKYTEIAFDDGVTVGVSVPEEEDLALVFDDIDYGLYLASEDLETDHALGFFMDREVIEELNETVLAGAPYQLVEERTLDVGPCLIGFAPEETDFFNENTPFMTVLFDGQDLGFVMVGFNDLASFAEQTAHLAFTLK